MTIVAIAALRVKPTLYFFLVVDKEEFGGFSGNASSATSTNQGKKTNNYSYWSPRPNSHVLRQKRYFTTPTRLRWDCHMVWSF